MINNNTNNNATGTVATTGYGCESESELIYSVTAEVLAQYTKDTMPGCKVIRDEVLNSVRQRIDIENANRGKNDKFKKPRDLEPLQIAMIITAQMYIGKLMFDKNLRQDNAPLAFYDECQGIYSLDESKLRKIIRQYRPTMQTKDVIETINHISEMADEIYLNEDPDLVAVNNGVFQYKDKKLLNFSPAYVFISKSKVDYNPAAQNVVIHDDETGQDWDFDSWISGLNDDPEVVTLLWQILGCIIRPNVAWGRCIFFVSTRGANGKGCLCEVMRELCGPQGHVSLSLDQFGKDFMLEVLTNGASAVICDETRVGVYLDDCSAFKAAVTNDILLINRKGRPAINYRFKGTIIECMNEMTPKIRDKSGAFMRRLLLVPFPKNFSGKGENKAIKKDYIRRKEVKEYVLYKVLNMNYYELSIPKVCQDMLEAYKSDVDIVRQYVDEMFPQFVWDFLPFTFLYDLFLAYTKKYAPCAKAMNREDFINTILEYTQDNPEWSCADKRVAIRPKNMMDAPERLIYDYNLVDWKNPVYRGNDINKICVPPLKDSYRGIQRNVISTAD